MRGAPGAEVRGLGAVLRQGFVVELAHGHGVEVEIELVFPAEFVSAGKEISAALAASRSSRKRAIAFRANDLSLKSGLRPETACCQQTKMLSILRNLLTSSPTAPSCFVRRLLTEPIVARHMKWEQSSRTQP
jgi:hypothetical protein